MTKAGPFAGTVDFEGSSDGGYIATGAMEEKVFRPASHFSDTLPLSHWIGSVADKLTQQLHKLTTLASTQQRMSCTSRRDYNQGPNELLQHNPYLKQYDSKEGTVRK